MGIECLVLGAGQEVGKSCVVVNLNGKKIMFDCGMHMGYHDRRRYPDFSLISKTGDFDRALTCIIITHFHLDHVGALPSLKFVVSNKGIGSIDVGGLSQSDGPSNGWKRTIYGRPNNCVHGESYTLIPIDLKQTVQVDEDLEIRAYYAGHVIGAAMIYASVGDAKIVYTGDYNMTPDRHLGAAQIDRLQLDLVITESTYATTVRDSKYFREREFLKAVQKCIAGGGKVLIPTFALGRAQELCILLEDYWERMNLKVPIYFSAGLTIQANMYSKMLISWTSQKVKEAFTTRNAFDFKHDTVSLVYNYLCRLRCAMCSFERAMINDSGPCVLFATPGMINGGFSLEVFKQWAPSAKNLVTLPGHCVAGTIGHKLMSGKPTKIDLDKDTQIDVRCQIHQLAFSAHTDSKGIMDLLKFLSPKHVMLVHGEKPKMATLKGKIQTELGVPCYDPANTETVTIPSTQYVRADVSTSFIHSTLCPNFSFKSSAVEYESELGERDDETPSVLEVCDERVAEGLLILERNQKAKVIHQDEWSGKRET